MSNAPDDNGGFSRRGFLKGIGVGSVASGLMSPFIPAQGAEDASMRGPGEVPVTLKINGQTKKLNIEPRVTLLDALRNRLDLTGAKKVCDRATCGACTVLLDGKGIYSCTVLAIEAQGRQIETVEGLAEGAAKEGGMAKIQRCFVENDAQQCGF